MFRYLPLIWKNSLRNRRRSVLAVASGAASLSVFGTLMAIYRLLFFGGDAAPAQALRLITHHKVSLAQSLPMAYVRQVRRIRGVRAATGWQWFGGAYRDARDPRNFFARFAVDPSEMFRVWPDYLISEDHRRAFEGERAACVASRALADKFGWKVGEHIPLVGDFFPVTLDLTLAGIFNDTSNAAILYLTRTICVRACPMVACSVIWFPR